MSQLKYWVNIIWSNEDNCYLVELPKFTTDIQQYFTHGGTYEEELSNAQKVLALLIESMKQKISLCHGHTCYKLSNLNIKGYSKLAISG